MWSSRSGPFKRGGVEQALDLKLVNVDLRFSDPHATVQQPATPLYQSWRTASLLAVEKRFKSDIRMLDKSKRPPAGLDSLFSQTVCVAPSCFVLEDSFTFLWQTKRFMVPCLGVTRF
jgi:hypothetical protein